MQFHNKRDIQKITESKWRVDNGDEAIIKRAQYDDGGLLD